MNQPNQMSRIELIRALFSLYREVLSDHLQNDGLARAAMRNRLRTFCYDKVPITVKVEITCDETNNPPSVIDAHGFTVDVYMTGISSDPTAVNRWTFETGAEGQTINGITQ